MKCCKCNDNAELVITNKDNGMPLCLACFYYSFRTNEITDQDTITILPKDSLYNKFLSDEV